jgi:hypothetical protein
MSAVQENSQPYDTLRQGAAVPPHHPPSKCSVCGVVLLFVQYGEKMGKNGKMAKWPIYEKCKSDTCSAGRKNLGLSSLKEEKRFEAVPLKLPPPSPTLKLFQLTNRVNPPLIFDDLWDALGNNPGAIKMHREDITSIKTACDGAAHPLVRAEWSVVQDALTLTMGTKEIGIFPADWKVTKGWGYYSVVRP